MFFSVVIPTYNRAEILEKTLNALYNQSLQQIDYEVIVVNDGSKDKTPSIAAKFSRKYRNFHYLKQANQGQGIARNNGIKKAKGKVIVLIGDDIIPTPDFLYEHQKFHYLYPEENSAVLGFTAWHPELKMNNFMSWMVDGSSVMGRFGGHQFAYEKLHGKKLADFNFFYTSNISLKRTLLLQYPFDQNFSSYGWEDIELGYRLQKEAKLKLYYNSWAVGYHHHQMDEKSLPDRMEAIGKAAWIIDHKYPELKKVPTGLKMLLLRLISFYPWIWFLRSIKVLSRNRFFNLYYYLLSKRHFLVGLKRGKKQFSKLAFKGKVS